MKINLNGVGTDFCTGKDEHGAEYCLIIGVNAVVQGEPKIDLRGCNSYVITSLDYLLDHTQDVLLWASDLRSRRPHGLRKTAKVEK